MAHLEKESPVSISKFSTNGNAFTASCSGLFKVKRRTADGCPRKNLG